MLKTWARHTHAIRKAGDLATGVAENTETRQGTRYRMLAILRDLSVLCGNASCVSDA
jgi:hypothetical protein